MNTIKRIPYGAGDFEAVQLAHDYYVDKTMYIPLIELSRFIFFIRPRRFGKTLLLSMLQSYYDINKKDRFSEFYHNTWILNNPTPERAKYMILYFNFSLVSKEREKIQEDFNNYCSIRIDGFLNSYKQYLPENLIQSVSKEKNSHSKLHLLTDGLENHDLKIYILIDEYDNFANALIAEYGTSEYEKLTKGTGYFKQFFTNLKGLCSGSGSGLGRLFITGVSPVTMDDVTSGFNIGDNISTDSRFNELLGFTEKDVHEIIDYYTKAGVFYHDKKETLTIMKKWYDNYQFSADSTIKVFNTDAILYFMMKSYQSKNMVRYLIDDNLRMDYSKLRHLISIDRRLNGNFSNLKEITDKGGISCRLKLSFPYHQLGDRDNFISLLYFFGLLTFSGIYEKGDPFFSIPNESIRQMMYEYIRASFQDAGAFAVDLFELQRAIKNMAYDGDWQAVFQFIASELSRQTRVRDYIQGEKVIQGFFLAYLNILDFYLSLSEEEQSKGYADIVLKPFHSKYPDMPFGYLLEFKYIARMEDKAKLEKEITKKIEQSRTQLLKYQADDFAKRMMQTPPFGQVTVKKGIVIFHGWELVWIEEVE